MYVKYYLFVYVDIYKPLLGFIVLFCIFLLLIDSWG